MGILPALYPRELLWAFEILPAEIWDPPGDVMAANAHLQTSICPIVKRSLEFILKAPELVTEGYLFPHTCDSLQNLATLVRDVILIPQPVRNFYNPKSDYNQAGRRFYRTSLEQLILDLEQSYGTLSQENLAQACDLSRRLDALLLEVTQLRQEDRLDLDNLEYFKLMRAGEYLLPQDYILLLESLLSSSHTAAHDRTRLLITGILPPQAEILQLLDQLGVSIVADDLLSLGRRIPVSLVDENPEPLEYLSDRYFLLPPCSTRVTSLDRRLRHLQKLVQGGQVHGILIQSVTFCEPELFDRQAITSFFKKSGLPALQFETELEAQLSGQAATRIEAFTELLRDRVTS